MLTARYEINLNIIKIILVFKDLPFLRQLVGGLLRGRSGFDSSLIYVRFLVYDVALGQVFILAILLSLSLLFNQCFIPTFMSMLLLAEGEII